MDRRLFGFRSAGILALGAGYIFQDKEQEAAEPKPFEAEFARDYEPPKFKLKWDKPQINRELAVRRSKLESRRGVFIHWPQRK